MNFGFDWPINFGEKDLLKMLDVDGCQTDGGRSIGILN